MKLPAKYNQAYNIYSNDPSFTGRPVQVAVTQLQKSFQDIAIQILTDDMAKKRITQGSKYLEDLGAEATKIPAFVINELSSIILK